MPKYGKYHTKPQEKRFVKEFVKTGNASQSALEAFNVKKTSSRQVGYNKLQQPHIQAMIKQALEEENINPHWVIKQRKKIIDEGMKAINGEQSVSKVRIVASDVDKNLQSLERIMNMGNDGGGGNNSTHQHLHIHSGMTRKEILDKRQETNEFFNQLD